MRRFPSRMTGRKIHVKSIFPNSYIFSPQTAPYSDSPISVKKITNIPETHSLKTLVFSLMCLPHPLYLNSCQIQWSPHTQCARNLSLSFHYFFHDAVRPFTLWTTSECIPVLPKHFQLRSIKPSPKLVLFSLGWFPLPSKVCADSLAWHWRSNHVAISSCTIYLRLKILELHFSTMS